MFITATAFDLGIARRAAAALIALLLVVFGATGWTHTDLVAAATPVQVTSNA